MDKIQIKGLVQGKHKLKDGSFAIGFRTLYGVVWITMRTFPKLFAQNPTLEKLFKNYDNGIDEENLINRYINVTNKCHKRQNHGQTAISPIL